MNLSRPSTHFPPSARARGFTLVLAMVFAVALAAVVAALGALAQYQVSARVEQKYSVLARQAADMGLARGKAMVDVFYSASTQNKDMDCFLDPLLNTNPSTASTKDDDGLPPLGTSSTYINTSSPGTGCATLASTAWTDADVDTVTYNGVRYRRKKLDLDAQWAGKDAAYLLRFVDNQDDDDFITTKGTTNNLTPDAGEGKDTDIPHRDRDQSIFIDVIGLSGGTDIDTAKGRTMVRATMRPSGGRSIMSGNDSKINNGAKICGSGAALCDPISPSSVGTVCMCGSILVKEDDSSYAWINSVAQCTATDCPGATGCSPLNIVHAESAACPPPPTAPPSLSATVGAMGNFKYYADRGYFYVHHRSAAAATEDEKGVWVWVWVHEADATCAEANWTNDTWAIPTPHFPLALSFPAAGPGISTDCWVPVFNGGLPLSTTVTWDTPGTGTAPPTGGMAAYWAANPLLPHPNYYPRSCAGDVVGGTLAACAAWSPPTGVTGGPYTGAFSPGTYTDTTFTAVPTSPTNAVALHKRLLAYGMNGASSQPVLTMTLDGAGQPTGTQVFKQRGVGNEPAGVYYWEENVDLQAGDSGSGSQTNTAMVANRNILIPSNAATTFCGPAELPAFTSIGATVDVTKTGVRIDRGIKAQLNIIIRNSADVGGDLIAGQSVTIMNSMQIAKVTPACSTYPASGGACAGAAMIQAGKNCIINNGAIFCANIECGNDVDIANGGDVWGTIYAGRNVITGNNLEVNPGSGGLLGSRPLPAAIQEIRY